MKYILLARFVRQLDSFPSPTKNEFEKQLKFLLSNLRHPSLRAKKYDEARGIWQARVDKHIRFYFLIESDVYVLLDIRKHPK